MSDSRIALAVLFGGRTGEYDVSCASAASILTYLDRWKYDILAVHIGSDGIWSCARAVPPFDGAQDALLWQKETFAASGDGTIADSMMAAMTEILQCDLVFPALHGKYGEDGAVQAMLEQYGIPYVGNGVLASALGMDKEYTKKLAAGAGLTVADDVVLRRGQTDVGVVDRDRLGLPVFVKPAREGSSIGVSRIDSWAQLPQALERARRSDEKVLVEAANFGREVDIGVLERPDGELVVSPPMEILHSEGHTFFDYQAKYDDSATVFAVPADLDPAVTQGLSDDAMRVFRELDCTGLLRVDFFVTEDGRRILNEVNTFPGFTSASQYPRMWQATGLSYDALLDILIATASASSSMRESSRSGRPPRL